MLFLDLVMQLVKKGDTQHRQIDKYKEREDRRQKRRTPKRD